MRRGCTLLVLIVVLLGPACSKSPPRRTALVTDVERFSYAMGLDIGATLKTLDTDVDIAALAQAIHDTMESRIPLMTAEEAQQIRDEFNRAYRERRSAAVRETAAHNLAESMAFLGQNREREGVLTTASGLQYLVLVPGSGPRPTLMDRVKVHYRGTLTDGTQFDSSYDRGAPVVLRVGDAMLPGWKEALQLMPVGSTYKFFLPPQLAYGPRSPGPPIGPNAALVLEIELLGIEAP